MNVSKKTFLTALFIFFLTICEIIFFYPFHLIHITFSHKILAKTSIGSSQINYCPVTSSSLPTTRNTHLSAIGSGFSSGYSILITNIIRNPQVTGDQPNSGYQYMEVDETVFNTGGKKGTVPGIFLFKDNNNNLYTTADMTGDLPSAMKWYANKNVSIPGKIPMSFVMLEPNQQQKTYLLYQVKKGESGDIIWNMNPFDNNIRYSTRIFSLY